MGSNQPNVPADPDHIADEFDQQWQSGFTPNLQTYLDRVGDDIDSRHNLLIELIAIDLEYRWKQTGNPDEDTQVTDSDNSDPWVLERYLQSWPELGSMEVMPVDLIAEEYRVRRRWGDLPSQEEYRQRFPLLAETLLPVLDKVDRQLDKDRPSVEQTLDLPGYDVEGLIGRGGMGVVWKARHRQLNRLVALKMIRTDFAISTEQRDRFRQEAEVVARLQHPNVVQIFDVGEHAGQLYLSFEFLPGGSLADDLRGVPQPPARAAEMVEALARAMHVVHKADIIHRDMKPANVLLGAGKIPKIADFGLARTLDDSTRQTRTGQIIGTPSYLAPEQVDVKLGEPAPATDVYALCTILYEMLTGRPPFHGVNEWDTIDQVVSQAPVPPRRIQPNVPRDLETICLMGLRKQPGRRYRTAEELADDLQRFRNREPIRARRTGPLERGWLWCRRRPVVASLLLVLVVLLTVATVVGAGYLHQVRTVQQNAELRLRQAEVSLDDLETRWTDSEQASRLLNDHSLWRTLIQEAHRANEQALQLVQENPTITSRELQAKLHPVKKRIERQKQDYDFITGTDRIHLEAGNTQVDVNRYSLQEALPKFVQLLTDYGLSPQQSSSSAIRLLKARPTPIADRALSVIEEMVLIDAFYDDAKLSNRAWYEAVLLEADPNLWRTNYRQAIKTGDRQAARKLLTEVDVREQSPQTLYVAARVLPVAYPEALSMLERAADQYPSDFWIQMALAVRYRDKRNLDLNKAVKHFTVALALRPKSVGVLVDLSGQLNKLGEYKHAVRVARRAVALQPAYATAHINLGAGLKALGKLDEAMSEYQLAIQHGGPDDDLALAYRNLGSSYMKVGDMGKAIESLRTATKLDPKYWIAHGELGRALKLKGHFREAIRSYRTAIDMNPNYYLYHYNLGLVYQTQGDDEKALACYDAAIRLNRNYAQAHCNRGNVLRDMGRFREGLASMKLGHAIGSRRPDWPYATAEWVKEHEKMVLADARVEDFRTDPQFRLTDAEEAIVLAQVCHAKKLFSLSVRAYETAINQYHDKQYFTYYNAACAAALAKGTPEENQQFRNKAFMWLQHLLRSMNTESSESLSAEKRRTLLNRLNLWQHDRDLNAIRDPTILQNLPARERQRWSDLWQRVSELKIRIEKN